MAPEIRARVQSVVRGSDSAQPADPILPDSVRFFIATDDPKGPAVTGAADRARRFESEYAGRADLTRAADRRYCADGRRRHARGRPGAWPAIEVLVDAGPRITILSPRPQAAYKGSVAVRRADGGRAVRARATARGVRGQQCRYPGARASGPGVSGRCWSSTSSTPPLIDDQLFRVVARNKQGTTAEARVTFFIDDDGPVFTETEPEDGQVVGGVVRIAAKVNDRAGVLGPSVIAFIGNRGGEGFELELRRERRPRTSSRRCSTPAS